MELNTVDQEWLNRCRKLGEYARSSGEAAVGCVITREGEFVSEACEEVAATRNVAGHAEIRVIQSACQALGVMDLADCTLYTNVEPCWMCSFAIRETGIAVVVIGTPVEAIGGATSQFPILSAFPVPGWGNPPEIRWENSTEGALS